MTERKPPGVPYETWVDRLVRRAEERGELRGLTGAGRPLPDVDAPRTSEEWVVAWARREEADLRAALPPSLAFRREKQDLLEGLGELPSERRVREVVEDFNGRLRWALLRPQEGPPLTTSLLDVEDAVRRWRAARPPEPATAPAPPPAPPAGRGGRAGARRRGWWPSLRRG